MMAKNLLIALFCLFAAPFDSLAGMKNIKISQTKVYQGDVIKVSLAYKSTMPFRVDFLGREHKSFEMNGFQTVLIGIDYRLNPGTYAIKGVYPMMESPDPYFVAIAHKIRVKKKYPKLKWVPRERSEEEKKKIFKNSAEINNAARHSARKLKRLKKFAWPIKASNNKPPFVTSKFEDKRCRRDKVRGLLCHYHAGTDYRAAFDRKRSKPEPVRAINDGRVVLVADHLLNGKTIVLDHGNGISSGYLHLSKFLVKNGDLVKRGQKIGIAGKTGATNAIHLHLFIRMAHGKTVIDPHRFLRKFTK